MYRKGNEEYPVALKEMKGAQSIPTKPVGTHRRLIECAERFHHYGFGTRTNSAH